MIVNLQKRYALHPAPLRSFVRSLKRCLRLDNKEFNVCLVEDNAIRQLNLAFRGKDTATDVLSFPWAESARPLPNKPRANLPRAEHLGIPNFLGDVAISVPTARRNARAEGHSAIDEIRWLILHGVLHLLGYDHERDNGEMVALELALREQLGVSGAPAGNEIVKKRGVKGEGRKIIRPRS